MGVVQRGETTSRVRSRRQPEVAANHAARRPARTPRTPDPSRARRRCRQGRRRSRPRMTRRCAWPCTTRSGRCAAIGPARRSAPSTSHRRSGSPTRVASTASSEERKPHRARLDRGESRLEALDVLRRLGVRLGEDRLAKPPTVARSRDGALHACYTAASTSIRRIRPTCRAPPPGPRRARAANRPAGRTASRGCRALRRPVPQVPAEIRDDPDLVDLAVLGPSAGEQDQVGLLFDPLNASRTRSRSAAPAWMSPAAATRTVFAMAGRTLIALAIAGTDGRGRATEPWDLLMR